MTPVFPDSDDMDNIERKRRKKEAVPPVEHPASEDIAEQQRPSSGNQQSLIYPRVPFSEPYRDGDSRRRVCFHVADVIDVQHSDAEQSDCRCRKQEIERRNLMRDDEIGSEHRHDSEEGEHGDVPVPPVSVRIAP